MLPIKGIPGKKKKELNELDMMEVVEVRVKLLERRAQALERSEKKKANSELCLPFSKETTDYERNYSR